jgi:hypothetical protein
VGELALRVLRGVVQREFFELLSFSEFFFAFLLGLPLFMPFTDFAVFPSSR